jgi:hypothetical protein
MSDDEFDDTRAAAEFALEVQQGIDNILAESPNVGVMFLGLNENGGLRFWVIDECDLGL